MRPDNIQEWLALQNEGQWFGFNGEATYENLVINGDYTKPTEEECNAGLATLQAEYDAAHAEYVLNRRAEYPSIGDQLDALFHAGVFPAEMAATIQAVKDAHPKPTEGDA